MKKIIFFLLILSSSTMAFISMSLDDPYEGITSNSVIEIVYDSSGIWLGTADGASYLADGDTTWRTFRGNSGLHSNEVSALAASVYNGTTYVCIATLHTESVGGENVPVGDGFSITSNGGTTWLPPEVSQPGNAAYYGKLSYDLDMYQDDIYSATFYGGLVYSMDGGYNWDNLYLNDLDSTDLVDSTFRSYSNRYFSVKVDTTLAPDTISVFAGTAYGINRFIFTDYNNGLKQDTAWTIGHSEIDLESSLPGNHVVALAATGEPGRIYDMFVVGNRAYVGHDQKGLYVVNITNPDNPATVGVYDDQIRAHGVFVDGDYAYVADYSAGLQILDITSNTPSFVGFFDTDVGTHDVFVQGDYAYVANHLRSVTIVNVSDPANPIQESEYMDYGGINGVYVVGDYAYLAAGDDGFVVVDITDPANPVLTGVYDSLSFANEVFIDSNLAYVADSDSGLVVLDITDPAAPMRVDVYGTPGDARSVYFENDNIYVTDDIAVRVFELSDDDTLVYLGGYDTPGIAADVVVAGDFAYVADNYSGMQILDIAPPESILLLGNLPPVCSSYIWAGCRVGVGESSQNYAVAYTNDYGKHWNTVIYESAWDFAFIGDTVIVATDNGLYISDDYENWDIITEIEDESGLSKYFPSGFYCVETVGSEIWAGGADGAVHRSADGSTWNVFRSQLYADDYFAYPSPFSPIASTRRGSTIHYKPPQTTDVTIKIYDFNLDLVATVIDGASRTGGVESDNDVWDGKNDKGKLVANGIYFYNIKLGTGEDWWGKVAVIK